ncbi:MAG: hypothetical protein IJ706_00380 [Clostridia bacterium]|nr:hypothetical protein [Clostridia bacterium]MBR1675756.1 hypothetical protein [Clostridia bacterium]
MNEIIDNKIIEQIKSLLENARQKVAAEVNSTLIMTYWQIGKIIMEDEQQHESRAEYGKQTLKTLSKVLTEKYGKGFSRSNLQNMRQFYLAYPKCQSMTGILSWAHYCELLLISDEQKRSFYKLKKIF